MLDSILPSKIALALNKVNEKQILELRLRVNFGVVVNSGKQYYLSKNGLTSNYDEAIICSQKDLMDIVFNATNHSLFAHNDELKEGYLTLNNGARLGVAGNVVMENGEVKTIKNFSSVNLRFAKEVKNCCLNALPYICEDGKLLSTLIISPPGCGKTTFIRDLSYQLSKRKIEENILIVDERNEICAAQNGIATLSVGSDVDFYTYSTKQFGIINGIRTMAPSVIILDEISTKRDLSALEFAFCSGVKIVATTHSNNYEELFKKPLFKNVNLNECFERFVILSKENGVGTINSIYNNAGICLFCG